MARRAIHDRILGDVLAVVDDDRPHLHEREQQHVRGLLQGEDEGEDVVRQALREAVERVERDGRERGRHDPPVVRLVVAAVDGRVVQRAVDPVDARVGEGEEERELRGVVPAPRPVGAGVVELAVAAHLEREDGRREDGDDGDGAHGLGDLLADLVLQEFGVREGGLVEDEEVGEGGAEEVDDGAEQPVTVFSAGVRFAISMAVVNEPCDDVERYELPPYGLPRQCAHTRIFRWRKRQVLARRLKVVIVKARCSGRNIFGSQLASNIEILGRQKRRIQPIENVGVETFQHEIHGCRARAVRLIKERRGSLNGRAGRAEQIGGNGADIVSYIWQQMFQRLARFDRGNTRASTLDKRFPAIPLFCDAMRSAADCAPIRPTEARLR